MSNQEDFTELRKMISDPHSDIAEVVVAYRRTFWHLGGSTTDSLISLLIAEVERLRATQVTPEPGSEPEPASSRWKKTDLEAEDPVAGVIAFRRQIIAGTTVWEAISTRQRGYGSSPTEAMISMLNARSRQQ